MGTKLGKEGAKLPKIYTTNWFRKGEDGKFVWPGYGENMRVLKWIIDRIEGTASGNENIFGISPSYEELNWTGLNFTAAEFKTVTSIDKAAWVAELKLHEELFTQLAYHLPAEMTQTLKSFEERLGD
jgi:phosphoenolpyruvate carboxykinase (GTP)